MNTEKLAKKQRGKLRKKRQWQGLTGKKIGRILFSQSKSDGDVPNSVGDKRCMF